MLASLLCNFPFVPGPKKIRWRNRFGEFDSYEAAMAAYETTPETVPEAPVMIEVPVKRKPRDDDALVFILAHI